MCCGMTEREGRRRDTTGGGLVVEVVVGHGRSGWWWVRGVDARQSGWRHRRGCSRWLLTGKGLEVVRVFVAETSVCGHGICLFAAVWAVETWLQVGWGEEGRKGLVYMF
jgi:hypothetical protein